MRRYGPVETRRILLSTGLGRVVFFLWLAMLLTVGVGFYLLRNSVDQSVGLLLIAAVYVAHLAVAPYVAHLAVAPYIDRLARRY